MIYLIRKLSKMHSCAKHSFTKPLLVIFLHQLIHWCIHTVSRARLWALGRSAPYSLLPTLITTPRPVQHRGRAWNTDLTVSQGPAVQWKELNWHQGCISWCASEARRTRKGDLLREGAGRSCSFRSPNRRFPWKTATCSHHDSPRHTFQWLETPVRKLKDVGTSRRLTSGASWTWHWRGVPPYTKGRPVLSVPQRGNTACDRSLIIWTNLNVRDRGKCLNNNIILNTVEEMAYTA